MKILYFDICALPIFIIILYATFVRGAIKGRTNILFICMVGVSLLATITDFVTVLLAQNLPLSVSDYFWCYFFSYLYFVLRNGEMVLYLFFLIAYTRADYRIHKKSQKLLLLAPYILMLFMLFENIFTDNVFFIDVNHGYQRAGFIMVIYVIGVFYVLAGVFYLFLCRKFISRGKWLSLFAFYLLSVASTVVQFFWPEILIEMFAACISLLLIILMVLRPEERIDQAVGLPSFRAYKEEIRKLKITKQKAKIIVVRFINANDIRAYLGEEVYNSYTLTVGGQIALLCKRNSLSFEIYFEHPGIIYLILDNSGFDVESYIDELYKDVRIKTKEIIDTGARFVPRICSIRVPEDMVDYDDIIHFGHEFHGLMPADQIFSRAADIIGSKDFVIKSNLDGILNRAISGRKLEMYYQPIYSLKEKKFISAEALIRLNDVQYGFIPPGLFIPAAESRGLVLPIGEFVLESVYRFISETDFEKLGLKYIEINLSVAQCLQKDLPDKINFLQRKYRVSPDKVNLEITETTYDNIGEVMDLNLSILSSMGYSFSLDDYGTGYSNMQRVSKLPLKIIKIDKTLVDEINSRDGYTILENTVKMMKGIRKELVVEGVEDEETAKKIDQMGCDFIQGYYYSRPLPEKRFVEFIEQQNNGKKE